jgi:hypothetical protein
VDLHGTMSMKKERGIIAYRQAKISRD